MNFTDPESLADTLLWLRADRDVFGGSVAHWNGVSNTQLKGPVNQGLQTGPVDFGFACWVRINARPPEANLARADTHIAGKWTSGTSASREWLLCLNSPSGPDQFCLVARGGSSGTSTFVGPRTEFPGGIELGRWYFVVAWHDRSARTLNLSVDGAAIQTIAYDGTPSSNAALPFTLGASNTLTGFPPISLSRAAFFKATPGGIGSKIGEIIESLYRGGAGASLADLHPDQPASWGLVAYWPLDERAGVRRNAYAGNRLVDLEDPTRIGCDRGPFIAPAAHDRLASGWIDQFGQRTFSATGAFWRGDAARLISTSRDDRLEHDGLFVSGKARWTATIVTGTHIDLGFGLYGESSGSGDDDYLDIRLSHDGVPELAIKPPGGPEFVARASDGMAGIRRATAIAADPVTTPVDSIPRVLCRVLVGQGHPFATGDVLWIKGLGPPFDGRQLITHATEEEIHYVVDNPETAPPTVGARRFDGGWPAMNSTTEGVLQQTLDHRFSAPWSGSQWSVAGWVRRTGDGPEGAGVFAAKDCSDLRPLGSRPQIIYGGAPSGSYRLDLPGSGAATFGDAPADAWAHLAAVRSGNLIALYYNGVPSGTLDVSSDPVLGSTFTGFSFGCEAGVASGLPCLLDNWGVWLGRSLSAAEVAALHGGGAGPMFAGLPDGLNAGLSAWYDFDEVSGAALDASGNGRHLVERGIVRSAEGLGSGVPFESAVTHGSVVGTGLVKITDLLSSDAGSGHEHRRFVLTVRRDGPTVSFFRNGEPIGSASIAPEVLGPSSGSTRILGTSRRLGSPRGSLEQVHLIGAALADEQVLGLAARFSVRVSRTRGFGPLSVQFDATQLAGVDRMASQDYHYLWAFTEAGGNRLHDESRPGWSGHAYARPTGFFISQVFEQEGNYDAHLAVVSPRYDRLGQPQEQSCLFVGKVASITVDPWPDTAVTYYVSSSHPNRSDAGPGTTPEVPLETIHEAIRRANSPFTRILLRSGDEFPAGPRIELSYPPSSLMIGAYGDPAAGKPTLVASARRTTPNVGETVRLTGCYDVRISGIAIRDTGITDAQSPEYAKTAYVSNGSNRFTLFRDLATYGTHRFLLPRPSDRYTIIDSCFLADIGDYTIYSDAVQDFSLTRSALEAILDLHFVRHNSMQRTQVSHCTRESPYPRGVFTWVTLRHDARFFVITDSLGDLMHTTIQRDKLESVGVHWGIIERNKLRQIQQESSHVTARGNEISIRGGSQHTVWKDVPENLRGGRARGVRLYGNQRVLEATVRFDGAAGYLVQRENSVLGSTTTLVPPSIEMAVGGSGWAILGASGYGVGGPETWSPRWMRRPVDRGGPFEPLVGQDRSVILDLPPGPGAYEYRVDLVTASGNEIIGAQAATVSVSGSDAEPNPEPVQEPGYLLEPPPSDHVMAGEPSAPFIVSVRGDRPLLAPVTVTPICDGPGRFDPPFIVLSAESPVGTFRYLPAPDGEGAWQVATTNDAGLIDPAPSAIIVTMAAAEPSGPLPDQFEMTPEVLAPNGDRSQVLSAPPLRTNPGRRPGNLPGPGRPSLALPPRRDDLIRQSKHHPDHGGRSLAPRPPKC